VGIVGENGLKLTREIRIVFRNFVPPAVMELGGHNRAGMPNLEYHLNPERGCDAMKEHICVDELDNESRGGEEVLQRHVVGIQEAARKAFSSKDPLQICALRSRKGLAPRNVVLPAESCLHAFTVVLWMERLPKEQASFQGR
jgi:hypothetical protein